MNETIFPTQRPEMILFDYGQTLIAEARFDGLRGTAAVMGYAVENKYHLTPEQVQREANVINRELRRSDPAMRAQRTIEVPNHMFTAYLYESLGIKINLSPEEMDRVFWDAASPGTPTEGIRDFLEFLWKAGIRTAVISNISYTGSVVSERIHRLLPNNHFEFILATSEYLFRKPHPRIFRLALEKADLKPENAWYVGDDYACDLAGARAAGLLPIWYQAAIDFAQADHEDVLRVQAWTELEAILRNCPERLE
ncbi:MAG: HAD family hydrolase [Oscillospiraceae bacterium]|nr:HAD family hydrolase [Oscillospiraceae bacterium]